MKRLIIFFMLSNVSALNHACAEELSNERQTELTDLLLQDCGSCHGMTLKGSLGPAITSEALANKSKEEIFLTISNGLPGTPMSPWKNILSEADIHWLVSTLKNGVDHEKK